MKKKVLIIDDDIQVCKEIKYALVSEATEAYYATSVQDALAKFMQNHFCLVIMDSSLSEANSEMLIKILQQAKIVPILVLYAKGTAPPDRAALLRAGASSFLEKPYDLEECLAQAQSLMRLYTEHPGGARCYTLAFGMDLIIDPTYWKATLHGQLLELTRKEFDLLYCLASHDGQVLSREQLYDQVWNYDRNINLEATIKSHIRSLRQKMSVKGKTYIENIRGVGYRFNSKGFWDTDE